MQKTIVELTCDYCEAAGKLTTLGVQHYGPFYVEGQPYEMDACGEHGVVIEAVQNGFKSFGVKILSGAKVSNIRSRRRTTQRGQDTQPTATEVQPNQRIPCPVGTCDATSHNQRGMKGHVRQVQDAEHNEAWQNFKRYGAYTVPIQVQEA